MSIRRYLSLILLSVITLVTFSAALQGYRSSMLKAEAIFDNELRALAHVFSTNPTDLNENSTELPDSSLIFQVWQHNQLLVSSNSVLSEAIAEFENGFSEHNFLSQRWRTYSQYFPLTQRWVIVAQPLNRRFELAEEMILAAVTPLVLSIPLLAMIIYMIINSGLGPLRQLSQNLQNKKINDLSAVKLEQDVKELAPVVHTLNQLFARLDSAFAREKRFASDAAHELRTPLSVLKINAHNLSHELSANEIKSTNLADLEKGIERMGHVVEQILLLNRTNPDQYRVNFTKVDLKKLCQNTISNIYPQISEKQQEIEFSSRDLSMFGDEFSLGILLQNLVTNASKYSPQKAKISVTLQNQAEQIILTVEDSGPGINATEFERVFERFYRIGGDRHSSSEPGCGLGLAISKHIAQLHNGSFKLAKSDTLGGLKISVVFQSNQHKHL
ncbi:ATP-binding protein [Paraglaciecola aquimarina]|uniref:histidine kinase n=1 Tax=Paraglaciecola algarum TaxID=3050085 RepID=A0ABS9D8X1_9ALTE|nr:ATP-binding protein [Paraglaciecola sp. G1-23]MCF2949240.1 ATP-binding protein [Paraglaciecola sp. G1-23]